MSNANADDRVTNAAREKQLLMSTPAEWTEESLFEMWQDYVERPRSLSEFLAAVALRRNSEMERTKDQLLALAEASRIHSDKLTTQLAAAKDLLAEWLKRSGNMAFPSLAFRTNAFLNPQEGK